MIKIFTAKDIPYGQLHNDYKFVLEIDNHKFSSISNYVYSNMVNDPLHKIALENFDTRKTFKNKKEQIQIGLQKTKDKTLNIEKFLGRSLTNIEKNNIKKEVENELFLQNNNIDVIYKYYIKQEMIKAIKEGLVKGYKSRLIQDEKFRDELKKNIGNTINIINEDNIHDVFINQYINSVLNQVLYEYNLSILKQSGEERQKQEKEFIFNIYRCEKILEKQIKNIIKNQQNNLKTYRNKNPREIVKIFTDQGGKDSELGIFETNKDFILKIQENKKDLIKKIKKNDKDTFDIIVLSMKKEIDMYIQDTRKKIIVQEYLNYIKNKNFPSTPPINDIMIEFKAGLTDSKTGEISYEYKKIQNEIYDCYQHKKLDITFLKNIYPKIYKFDKISENIYPKIYKFDKISEENIFSGIEVEDKKISTSLEDENEIISTSLEDENEIIKAFKIETKEKQDESKISSEKQDKSKISSEKNIINIDKNNILNPYYNKEFIYENRRFNSVLQVVYYHLYLISATQTKFKKGATSEKSYELVKDANLQINYLKNYNTTEEKLFEHYLKISYSKKFSDRDFVSILCTIQNTIEFPLQEYSNNIITNISNTLINDIKNKNMKSILYKDIFSKDILITDLYDIVSRHIIIKDWYFDKLIEFIDTVNIYSDFLKRKDIVTVQSIIKNIYSNFFYDNMDIKIPEDIIDANKSILHSISPDFFGLNTTNTVLTRLQNKIAEFFCQTILSVIKQYINIFEKPSMQDLKYKLTNSQYDSSNQKQCNESQHNDPIRKDLDCIYQSINNVLSKCKNILKELNIREEIKKEDVEFSKKLLLRIKPTVKPTVKPRIKPTVKPIDKKEEQQEEEQEYKEEQQEEEQQEEDQEYKEEQQEEEQQEEEQQEEEQDYEEEQQEQEDEETETKVDFDMREPKYNFMDISEYKEYYIKNLLKNYENEIGNEIWNAMSTIFFYRMNPHIKFMRINFFSS
jgi:hypothetical protein